MSDQTLGELLRRVDAARNRLMAYDMTNHYAYLRWPEADRIEFDVGREKARIDLQEAEAAYRNAINQAARFDPK